MRRRFVTLDVFTDRPFAGNPLAIVLDAEGLGDAAMQAVAREFNLSETVFVLPPAEPAHRAALRIFTPAAELPFAGHPTVGTAVALARIDGGTQSRPMVLAERIGPVRCEVAPNDRNGGTARFALPRLPEHLGDIADAAEAAAALSLTLDDLGCGAYEPGRWSAGVPFAIVPVRGLDAIGRARPDLSHWAGAFGVNGHPAVFVFCAETAEPGHHLHARMFAPSLGVREDPATGSAVAALASVLARHGKLGDGEHAIAVEQGYEMGRPSIINLTLTLKAGALAAASIGGGAVEVSQGTIEA